ncbi:hypothetical protein B296_00034568 [Ensete ventricosum]|uniref:Uncharacterized protein n=1 Tax=Ensete ventricosum TaxID=4639 RepID=A0A426Z255_ENSVE|nr:hypothetical protein B296_00034568 [Ensete ventricosum]
MAGKQQRRSLACGGRSGDDKWRLPGCDRGGQRRGATVAPNDKSLLVAAKGSRSGLGEHERRLREVDLCSRSLRGGGATTVGRDVLIVEIEQRDEE